MDKIYMPLTNIAYSLALLNFVNIRSLEGVAMLEDRGDIRRLFKHYAECERYFYELRKAHTEIN